MTQSNKRAQQVILEILRQAGGRLDKVRLYKAFYHAHLNYAERCPGFLSSWPIARMPRGPGIDGGSKLLDELKHDGLLSQEGDRDSAQYCLSGTIPEGEPLSEDALLAIRQATELVLAQTPEEASEHAHNSSRAWREGRNGDILNIYTDMVPEEEFRRRQDSLSELDRELQNIFGEQSR